MQVYDFCSLIDLQAIDFDPTDATLLSNRSLCWIRLGQAEQSLADARACKALKPDWPKAYYREGAALRLLQVRCHPNCKDIENGVWRISSHHYLVYVFAF